MKELKEGVIKFRGFAMLCFGNFRFAYKQLIEKDAGELEVMLEPYCRQTTKVLEKFKRRPPKAIEIDKIDREQTWYTGYISKTRFVKESALLRELIESTTTSGTSYELSKSQLISLGNMYKSIGEGIKEVEARALRNTDIYLTWDYMDVYVATSMRHKWEFEETYDFINEVFNDRRLRQLNLRYFDPTQSQCRDRIDKGLIEGLMLKRALCTIYMAQEVDTLGKDSELAATLAQRKPVIAYVPRIDIHKHAEKIEGYSLDFFNQRLLVLNADGIFADEDCRKELRQLDSNFEDTIDNFIEELGRHRSSQPFSMWNEKDDKFKRESPSFSSICKLFAIAEHHSYEKRARTLKEVHPLAIQVDLESGVANGVLVVRSPEHCANLLHQFLMNSMNFTIRDIGEKDRGVTILEEKISKCPFRVVTDYEKLTNSFWNFYLSSD